ncbi:MAG TPA: glycosyltransferase family 2 protein [Flavobacterium sp.]|jgi:glycosyltransferase involved in cell wall biosynthesis
MGQKKFSILITSKNRLSDLIFTLEKCAGILYRPDVTCIICDDGSTDGTFSYVKSNYPNVTIFRNDFSKGLIYSRNRLMAMTTTEYAISIDDDLHIISEDPLDIIEKYFTSHPDCAVISFRVFWGKKSPDSSFSDDSAKRVQSFLGGAHAWRMSDWSQIPEYPSWFMFHGEEDFISYNLFKIKKEVHYVPAIFAHHRVDIRERKNDRDYAIRLRRSLRSGWYLYWMFVPLRKVPKKMAYSLWIQFKLKVLKGDYRALIAIVGALVDLILSSRKIYNNSNRLTNKEYELFQQLPSAVIYWTPQILKSNL